MMSVTYLSETGEADPEKTEALRDVIAAMQEMGILRAKCGICHSSDLKLEDAATQFATMAEAKGPLAEEEMRQTMVREFLRRSRN
jgi:hypothetical protein